MNDRLLAVNAAIATNMLDAVGLLERTDSEAMLGLRLLAADLSALVVERQAVVDAIELEGAA